MRIVSWVRAKAALSVPNGVPRPDARDKEQREVVKFLREQHLPGVDTDDDASVTLEVEQARLTLFACAGVIAFEVTQLLAAKRLVCVTPLYWSMVVLMLAMAGAWIALIWSEHLRRFRVDRRYTIYHGELDEYLAPEDASPSSEYPTDASWSGQIRLEARKRRRLRLFRYGVGIATAIGIGAGVLSAIGTADPRRCHYELLQPQRDAATAPSA